MVHAHHIRLLYCNLHRKSGLSQRLRLADTPISAFACVVAHIDLLCEGGARSSYSNHSAAEPPPRRAMAPRSVDNGKVKKDITKLPWHCAHHIRVIYTVNGMLLYLGYGCSSASPPINGEVH